MSKTERYIVIYQKETDGDICVEYCEFYKIENLLKKYRLDIRDIAIVKGKIVKEFGKD